MLNGSGWSHHLGIAVLMREQGLLEEPQRRLATPAARARGGVAARRRRPAARLALAALVLLAVVALA
jgi:hypothetical protein